MVSKSRITRRLFVGGMAALTVPNVLASGQASAQGGFPSRPIRVIIPQAAGSGADVVARIIAERLSLGEPVVVENRPGANGTIAAQELLSSAADGHTLMLAGFSQIVFNQFLYQNLPYDPLRDFTFIGPVVHTELILLVSEASGIKTVEEFIARARAAGGSLPYGSGGTGNSSHLAMAMIQRQMDIDLLQIPYPGTTPIFTALMQGEVAATIGIPQSALPLIRDGRVRAIAALGANRVADLPEVPTLTELGYDVPHMPGWYVLVGPKGVPEEVVQHLNEAVNDVLREDEVRDRLRGLSLEPIPGTSEEIFTQAQHDADVWGELIVSSNIRLD